MEVSPVLCIVLFLLSGVLLAKSATVLVKALISISRFFRLPEFVVSFIIMSVATSLPELFVGIVSAARGNGAFALAAVIGSNIADLTLVAGILAIVAGVMGVRKILDKRDAYYTGLVAVTLLLFLLDGMLSRFEGIILVIVYALFMVHLSGQVEKRRGRIKKGKLKTAIKSLGLLAVGIIGLLFGAEVMVRSAEVISKVFNLPFVLMGLLLVSLSTSVPELVFEIQAWRKKHRSMALGDLLGSIVTNTALVAGVVAIVTPVNVVDSTLSFEAALVFLFASTLLFLFFLRTGKTLTRFEGVTLVAVYVLYIFVEYAQAIL